MQALMIAAPMLGLIGLGVATVGLFGRDPQAEEHDLADYHEPSVEDFGPIVHPALDILPPAPPGVRVSLPLYAEQVVAEQMRAQYGTTDSTVIAARMLREIAEDEHAKVGIGPDGHAWQLDGSCWADCPGCARDLTGAFPVVRAA